VKPQPGFLGGFVDESFKEKIQKDALKAVVKSLEEKISKLVCPTHHQSPRLKFSEGAEPGKQNMGYDCCCDTLGQMVKQALEE